MAASDRASLRLQRAPEERQRGPSIFGDFEFDAARGELRRRGHAVSASSLSLNLLDYLLTHRDRVVGRQELVDEVWRGVTVTEGSLRQAIWELRQTLDDSADKQNIIRTVRGRGYRFVGAPHEHDQAGEVEAARAPSPGRQKTLCGREAELEQLLGAVRAATRESGRACAIVGAPGIGKTHLTREIARRVAEQDVIWLEAAADPDRAAPAFWPWLRLLRDCLEARQPARRNELTQQFPHAWRLLGPLSESCPRAEPRASTVGLETARDFDDSPSHERFAMLSELAGLLLAALGEVPTVLAIEDLQWADEGSLALLRHLVPLLPRTRAVLIATSRAQRPRDNRPLARTLEAIVRSATGLQLVLSGLNLEEVSELLALHASAPVLQGVAAQIFALSGGNPLFASELAILLARSEAPVEAREQNIAEAPNEPLEFGSVIQRRLYALPEAALSTVLAASVLGPEFSLAQVAALLQASPQEALLGIDLCIDHGLFLDRQEPLLCFVHPLVREAAYASVSRSERCRLHRLAGEWLERSAIDAHGTRQNELAHHFFHAAPNGACAKAVGYALRCAQLAYAATAYKDAVAHYDRAISCMDLDAQFGVTVKLETALLRGEALRASGTDTASVNQYFLALAEQAEAQGENGLFARAVLGYTGQRSLRFTPTRFAVSSNLEESALIERALAAVGDKPSELRALLLCSLLGALMYRSERLPRERAAAEATAIARKLDLPHVTVRVLNTRVYCCATPETDAERLELCDELLAIAAQHGLRAQEADGLITRALCHLSRGDTSRAQKDEERARSIAQTLAAPQVRARSELLDLMRAIWVGDLTTAKRLTESALNVTPEDAAARAIYMLRVTWFQAIESGSLADSIAGLESMLASFPAAIGVRCGLASNHAMLGNRQEALRHFEFVAQDDFKGLPQDLGWLGEMSMLAEVPFYLDDRERAERVYVRLAPYGGVFNFLFGEVGPAGPIAYWLASLAATLRDFPLAHHWLEVARELNRRVGSTLHMQHLRLIEARVLYLEDRANAESALLLIRNAKVFAEQRGLLWLVRCGEREERALFDACGPRQSVAGGVQTADRTLPSNAQTKPQ